MMLSSVEVVVSNETSQTKAIGSLLSLCEGKNTPLRHFSRLTRTQTPFNMATAEWLFQSLHQLVGQSDTTAAGRPSPPSPYLCWLSVIS